MNTFTQIFTKNLVQVEIPIPLSSINFNIKDLVFYSYRYVPLNNLELKLINIILNQSGT